jgi:hypothetical protein
MRGHSILFAAICWMLFAFNLSATVFYVDVNSTNPVPPYASWSTASTDIQSAINISTNGDLVNVTNGIYRGGISINDSAIVQSVNGAIHTFIDGNQTARCAGMANSAILNGFTLTNGSTSSSGGGAAGGTLNNCTLIGNYATVSGGGAFASMLNDCILSNNVSSRGGGAEQCVLNNGLIVANQANNGPGGGADGGRLNNCTVVGNHNASFSGAGGGTYQSAVYNSIVYNNTSISGTPNWVSSSLYNCCTTPLPSGGGGNIAVNPLFVNITNDFHLQSNSPCINAGNNAYVFGTNDLDGNPRIVGGTVDIGAYEYQTPSSVLSYAWAQQYGLPTDGTVDYADTDGDHMSNYAEWKAGTVPTNAASVLALQSPATANSTGIKVTWQSVSGVTYYLQSSTNFPAFTSIQSNLVGLAGSTSYTDTTATNGGPYFYRVGVQ